MENYYQVAVDTYGAYKKVKEVKDKTEEYKKYADGLKGLYDFNKQKDVESFRRIYEAFKEVVDINPIGHLMMTFYSTGFELFLKMAQQIQDADKIKAKYEEVLSLLKTFSKDVDSLIKTTEYERYIPIIANGPFTYIGKLQSENPGIPFEVLAKESKRLTDAAVNNVRTIDKVLKVMIPLFNNLILISDLTLEELNKANTLFSIKAKDEIVIDRAVGDSSLIDNTISSLNNNRNCWGKWTGMFTSVDRSYYEKG